MVGSLFSKAILRLTMTNRQRLKPLKRNVQFAKRYLLNSPYTCCKYNFIILTWRRFQRDISKLTLELILVSVLTNASSVTRQVSRCLLFSYKIYCIISIYFSCFIWHFQTFSQSSHLRVHTDNVHNTIPLTCDHCQKVKAQLLFYCANIKTHQFVMYFRSFETKLLSLVTWRHIQQIEECIIAQYAIR